MRIVIVGAGLSGLSLAAFLRRLSIDCVVLEQAPFLHANFQVPITLYANALSCFKAFGFGAFFDQELVAPESSFGIRDAQGKWLMEIANREVALDALRDHDAIPLSTAPAANSNSVVSLSIAEERRIEMGRVPLRGSFPAKKLKQMLRQFTPEVRFDCRVVDLIPHDGVKGGVHVVLADGSMEWGDVVVGADGMHSTIRKLLYPEERVATTCKSLGMQMIDGSTVVAGVPEALGESPCEFWGDRSSVAYMPLFHHGERKVGFTATLYQAPQELVNLDIDPMDGEQLRTTYRGVLAKEFASYHPDLVKILRNADIALPTEGVEVPIMTRWFNRRAVLIGEAAHGAIPCFLGQDSSLCVEDAALLATSLVDVPLFTDSGFEYAFRLYESVRRDRVEKYIRHSRRARKFTATPHISVRNTVLQATPSFALLRFHKWLANWSYSAQQLELDPKVRAQIAYRM